MFDIVMIFILMIGIMPMGLNTLGGKVKHYPYIPMTPQNEILIVAGDVSDNLQNTIKYSDDISQYYQKILFIGRKSGQCISKFIQSKRNK